MPPKNLCILEFGSHSLKLYHYEIDADRRSIYSTRKIPWRFAHEFYRTGTVTEDALAEIIGCVNRMQEGNEDVPRSRWLAFATGVFRELPSADRLLRRIGKKTGIRVWCLSGASEAKMMALSKDYHLRASDHPLLLFDLGGATTEWAWYAESMARAWGSVRLGAVRGCYALSGFTRNPEASSTSAFEEYCDERLRSLPSGAGTQVVGTGGTVKAAARCLGTRAICLSRLHELIERVRVSGPPPCLEPSRQEILLPGLLIMTRILTRCGATALTYEDLSRELFFPAIFGPDLEKRRRHFVKEKPYRPEISMN